MGEVEVTNVEGMSGGFVGLDTSPDGTRLVATTQQTDQLLAFDTDSLALEQVAAVSVASGPYDVRYSPDGASVWFPNQDANVVTRVDPHTWKVATVVEHASFEQPHGVAVAPGSRTVYISNHGMSELKASPSNGSVAMIDAVEGTVRQVTEVGPYAAAIGRRPH
jgi:DNA-binding beta-propeller fold protein YncE